MEEQFKQQYLAIAFDKTGAVIGGTVLACGLTTIKSLIEDATFEDLVKGTYYDFTFALGFEEVDRIEKTSYVLINSVTPHIANYKLITK